MKEIIFKSPHEHYEAEATILWCFDARFRKALNELIRKKGFKNTDIVSVAGGAKNLISPEYGDACDQSFLIDQIKKSVSLHNPQEIILMLHSDCGAYGGLKAFGGDKKAEYEKRLEELKKAKTLLKKEIGEKIKISAVFADFEKISVI